MWTVVSAVQGEGQDLGSIPLGVGPVAAAAAMAALIGRDRPRAVLLVGSAGAYREDLALGEAVVGVQHGWAHSATVSGTGYVPMPPPVLAGARGAPARLGCTGARVLTVGAITTDGAVAQAWAGDWDVEHMEAYAAALACARAEVPFVAVLGISNRVGPDAHAEWVAHRGRAEAAAQTLARRLLGCTPSDIGCP